MKKKITPTPHEIHMKPNELIVSKTDTKGRLTYCNRTFIRFSGYTERELLGQQHNIIRHPDMPRSVFHLLWSTIQSNNEFFGYVKNISRDGSFYWVLANITPRYAKNGTDVIGFFSVRRAPDPVIIKKIESIYQEMLMAEQQARGCDAIMAGSKILTDIITTTGKDYREFILSL